MKKLLRQSRLLTLFAAILFVPLFAPATAIALQEFKPNPALWKITDEDSEIFLFGTVHILRPDLKWKSEKVTQAFNAASTIVFEAPADNSNPQKMQALIAKYGLNPPGTTLSSLLSANGRTRLASVLSGFGMPAGSSANFEPLRPWLVGITLAALQIQATGGDPNAGVERILSAEAAAAGKRIGFLESDEQQMQILSSLSPQAELYFLEDGLRQIKENPNQINDLVSAWRAGYVPILGATLLEALEGQPEVYDKLLVQRNHDWARQIEEMLSGSGTVFVAVGAAHLVGSDSVQSILGKKGIWASRQR